jgi:VIT1/CCC1 family predicted Fe2+/Mn2+ transporter
MPLHKLASLSLVNYSTGISDGLVLPIIPCLLILGYYDGSISQAIVLFSVIACFGGLVYGLARYFGEKNEIAHNHPHIANEALGKDKILLKKIGIGEELITGMMRQVEQEQEQWLKEIKENDMTWEALDLSRAKISGVQTGIGFCTGSCLIAIPLFLFFAGHINLLSCLGMEGVFLFLFGWLKGKWIGKAPIKGAISQVIKGFMVIALLTLLFWALSNSSFEKALFHF